MTIKEYIQKYVLLKIVSKEWKDGDILPSENKISKKFNCSRLTARQALGTFVRAGILEPQKGRGYVIIESGIEDLFESNTSKFKAIKTKVKWIEKEEEKAEHFDFIQKNYIDNQDFIDGFNLEEMCIFIKEYYSKDGLVSAQVSYLSKEIYNILSKENVETGFTKSLIEHALIPTSNKVEYFVSEDPLLIDYKKELGWHSDPVISVKQLFLNQKLIETSIRMVKRSTLRVRNKKEIIL